MVLPSFFVFSAVRGRPAHGCDPEPGVQSVRNWTCPRPRPPGWGCASGRRYPLPPFPASLLLLWGSFPCPAPSFPLPIPLSDSMVEAPKLTLLSFCVTSGTNEKPEGSAHPLYPGGDQASHLRAITWQCENLVWLWAPFGASSVNTQKLYFFLNSGFSPHLLICKPLFWIRHSAEMFISQRRLTLLSRLTWNVVKPGNDMLLLVSCPHASCLLMQESIISCTCLHSKFVCKSVQIWTPIVFTVLWSISQVKNINMFPGFSCPLSWFNECIIFHIPPCAPIIIYLNIPSCVLFYLFPVLH